MSYQAWCENLKLQRVPDTTPWEMECLTCGRQFPAGTWSWPVGHRNPECRTCQDRGFVWVDGVPPEGSPADCPDCTGDNQEEGSES